MSRRSWALWAGATLTALAPTLCFQLLYLLTGDDGVQVYVTSGSAFCPGFEMSLKLPVSQLREVPLLYFGGAPLIVLGCAAWWMAVRRGRGRLGRTAGRCVAGALILSQLSYLLPMLVDLGLGPGCAALWGPPDEVGGTLAIRLYDLLPPVLILLAVRPERFTPRGPVFRTTAAVLTAAAVLLLVAESAPAGEVSWEPALDCAGLGHGTVRGLDQGEKRFLCAVRGYTPELMETGGIPGWERVPDREVLAQGRQLCDVATRNGGDVNAAPVQAAPQASLAKALPSLCPAVVRAQQAEEQRGEEEERAYVAAAERACAAHPRHRPRLRPVRQRQATMWTEFWQINGWEDGYEGTTPDLVEDLVGSERGALALWAADEVGNACVTTESYARRPPLELKGWDEVVEVGYESPKGSLCLVDGDGQDLCGLTPQGPGSYRVRVHLRGRKLVYQVAYPPEGAVELLIMIYPGKAEKPVVYR
ncbi:hypothetical protein JOL79_32015 [Microbispora sp. RL4-1S]|uniref:Uncharacterized protein n=1 Tax=Microbispora oryzae TaxID=2806554 RepID=A0A941ALB4_9ACTN|nr:hypothetical protein [Microbispora oryzae]MBP2708415.1 hypothetical protein [Microbispora oryzae]